MLFSVIILCALLFGGYVLLAVLVRMIRRRTPNHQNPPEEYDWQITDLQRLRDAGQLSDEEFQRAREVILANARLRNSSQDNRHSQQGFDVLPRKPR